MISLLACNAIEAAAEAVNCRRAKQVIYLAYILPGVIYL